MQVIRCMYIVHVRGENAGDKIAGAKGTLYI